MQVELIRWLDTGLAVADGWQDVDYYKREGKCSEVVSSGLLVFEDDDRVILANSYDPDHDTYVNAMVISKSAIITRATPTFDEDIRLLLGMKTDKVAA